MRHWKNDKELFTLMKTYLYTAVVGDIMDEMGLQNQFLPQRIRPLKENMILVGRAMTVLESDLVLTAAVPTIQRWAAPLA